MDDSMSGHAKRVPEAIVHPAACHLWPALSRVRLTIVRKVAVRAANAFNLNRLRSRSLSQRTCSLAAVAHSRSFSQLIAEVHIGVDIKILNPLI